MALDEMEHRGGTPEMREKFGNHIVQYSPEYSLCAGCESCSIICGLTHDGFTGPENCRIKVDLGTRSMMHHILACQQCSDHPCYNACPKKDQAMCIDQETGVVYIEEAECVGCGLCARACVFEPSRISIKKNHDRKKWKAVKCDLCRGRKEGPACIEYCPVRCLGLSEDSLFIEGEASRPDAAGGEVTGGAADAEL